MRFRHLIAAILASVAASLLLPPTASAAKFKPPQIDEPKAHPDVWFGQRKDGRWCAFSWKKKSGEFLGGFETAWARYENGRLASLTTFSVSEDAASQDRYFFDPDRRLTKMIRTGHYVEAPWASFTYVPDALGKLKLTPEAKALEARMGKATYETYFVDWPIYSSVSAMPFAELVDWNLGAAVRLGCAKHPKPIEQ